MLKVRLVALIAFSIIIIAMLGCSDEKATLFDVTPESTSLAAHEQFEGTYVLTVEKNGVVTETKELTPHKWTGAESFEKGQVYSFPSKEALKAALVELGKTDEVINNLLTQGSNTSNKIKSKESGALTKLSSWPSYTTDVFYEYDVLPPVQMPYRPPYWVFDLGGSCTTIDDPSQSNDRRTTHVITIYLTLGNGSVIYFEEEYWNRDNPTSSLIRGWAAPFTLFPIRDDFYNLFNGSEVYATNYSWQWVSYPTYGVWEEEDQSYLEYTFP